MLPPTWLTQPPALIRAYHFPGGCTHLHTHRHTQAHMDTRALMSQEGLGKPQQNHGPWRLRFFLFFPSIFWGGRYLRLSPETLNH